MNGRDKCSTEVRDRVLSVAKDLGYTRNMAAKTLVEQRSNLIGLVLPSYINEQLLTRSPFYNLIIDAVNATLREDGEYDLIINCVSGTEGSRGINEWTLFRSLDGLIIVGDFPDEDLRFLDERGVPMVFIDSYRSTLVSPILVNTDDDAGGYLAAQHLVSRGYRKLAICTTDIEHSSVNQQRFAGFSRALAESGIAPLQIEAQNNLFAGGVEVADRILELGADSIFAVNDVLAAGIVKRLVTRGVRVPKDFGVIGFDNLEICTQLTPELTTVDQDIFGKGKTAVELLMKAIRNENPVRRKLLPTKIVARQTT